MPPNQLRQARTARPDPSAARKAFVESLYQLHHHRVSAFLRRLTDPATADDLSQEVFVRLMTARDLESRQISSSYLIKIADNLLKRHYRKAATMDRHVGNLLDTAKQNMREPKATAGHGSNQGKAAAADDELMRQLDAALRSLTHGEQDAVRMIVCGDLSYQQAASATGSRVTTVNNWRHRGLERLRKAQADKTDVA
ncbi:MAG: RNA polymerase sigma factor [Planctomycetota bacterium]